jgi:hypothetical protein
MDNVEWSKPEKTVARRAFRAAHDRECRAIADNVRKMAAEINDSTGLWQLSEFLTKKRSEMEEKYDYRYSILLSVFARLTFEGWARREDLAGLSEEKLQEISRIAEFMSGI